MDEDAADGPDRPDDDWDDLTPAVERVGARADDESAEDDATPSDASSTQEPEPPADDDDGDDSSSLDDGDDGDATDANESDDGDATDANESDDGDSEGGEDAPDFDGAYDSHEDALETARSRAEAAAAADEDDSDDGDAEDSDDDSDSDDADDGPEFDGEDDPDAVAEAVIQADEASWHPDNGPEANDDTKPNNDVDISVGGPDTDSDESGEDVADAWEDLTPAVERVAPVPAVERVAPTPAITRVEDDDVESGDDFTSPATDFTETDTFGDETATQGPVKKGPPDDAEQPLAVHIEEMVKRLGIVVGIAGAVSLALFPLTGEVINFLWYSILPGTDVAAPHVYHPLEYKLTQLKVASLGGLLIALPVFVYQTYRFMRPGLYPHERRYYLASVPTSLILGLLGVTFAYFIVLPAVMSYFLYYSQTVVTIAFALGATFDLILLLMGYLAVVFQIPLFVMLAIMMGLTTREWLAERRLLFWGAFLGISFLFSPDPTGMAPVLVAATMIVLFEGTLLLLRWTGR